MKKSKKDKQLENLLFEVYEKGVNNEDCDLTACIEKVKKALTLTVVVKSDSELLNTEVFNLANKLAINGFGNEARKMHQICNGM